MEEEDNFHKTITQKKQKLDPRIHRSTPTVVPASLCDSKRPIDHFHRGVFIISEFVFHIFNFFYHAYFI